jgi:hypothetical protein
MFGFFAHDHCSRRTELRFLAALKAHDSLAQDGSPGSGVSTIWFAFATYFGTQVSALSRSDGVN